MNRARLRLPLQLLLLPLLIGYALHAWHFEWLCDDAYISFRYARHLAEGKGLVFNALRHPPAEGYSNFLWVVWLGAFEAIGQAAPTVSAWTSGACGAVLIFIAQRPLRSRSGPDPDSTNTATTAAAIFLAALPATAVWATSGLAAMPTALFLLLCHRALAAEEGPHHVRAAIWALLVALLRADGAVWIALLFLGHLCAAPRGTTLEERMRPLWVPGLCLALGVAAHLSWRVMTYHDWLPLTARVKAGFSNARLLRGVDYAAAWILALPAVGVALAIAGATVRSRPRRTGAPALFLVLGGTLYAIWVGGDFMPFGRFLFPAVPFVALVFGDAIAIVRGRFGAAPAWGTVAATVALSIAGSFDRNPIPETFRQRFHFRADRAWQTEPERLAEMDLNVRRWVLLGRALDTYAQADEALILGGIGAVSYHSDLFIYDAYGLVTPEVVAQGRVISGASPGHDLRVHPPFFLEHQPPLTPAPTLMGAYLTPAEPLEAEDPLPWWTDVRPPADWSQHRWSKWIDAERHPLDPKAGFPENAELVLLRVR